MSDQKKPTATIIQLSEENHDKERELFEKLYSELHTIEIIAKEIGYIKE